MEAARAVEYVNAGTVEFIVDPDLARRFQMAIATQGNYVSYCYCSIFDECWLADSRQDLQNPEPVEVCPDFGDESFEN